MVPPRSSDASKVAVSDFFEIGVPAGAVVTVSVRPSGSWADVPGSRLMVTG